MAIWKRNKKEKEKKEAEKHALDQQRLTQQWNAHQDSLAQQSNPQLHDGSVDGQVLASKHPAVSPVEHAGSEVGQPSSNARHSSDRHDSERPATAERPAAANRPDVVSNQAERSQGAASQELTLVEPLSAWQSLLSRNRAASFTRDNGHGATPQPISNAESDRALKTQHGEAAQTRDSAKQLRLRQQDQFIPVDSVDRLVDDLDDDTERPTVPGKDSAIWHATHRSSGVTRKPVDFNADPLRPVSPTTQRHSFNLQQVDEFSDDQDHSMHRVSGQLDSGNSDLILRLQKLSTALKAEKGKLQATQQALDAKEKRLDELAGEKRQLSREHQAIQEELTNTKAQFASLKDVLDSRFDQAVDQRYQREMNERELNQKHASEKEAYTLKAEADQREMQRRHELAVAEWKAAHADATADIQAQLEAATRQVMDMAAQYKIEKESLVQASIARAARLEQETDQKLEALRDRMNVEYEKQHRSLMQAQEQKLAGEYSSKQKQAIQELKRIHVQQWTEQSSQLQMQYQKKLVEQIDEREQDYNKKVAKIHRDNKAYLDTVSADIDDTNRRHAAEVESLRSQITEASRKHQDVVRKHGISISIKNREHADELSSLTTRMQKEHTKNEVRMLNKHAGELEKLNASMLAKEAEAKDRITKLGEQIKTEKESRQAAIKMQQDEQARHVEGLILTHNEAMQQLQDAAEETKRKHSREVKELTDRLKQTKDDLMDDFDIRMESLREEVNDINDVLLTRDQEVYLSSLFSTKSLPCRTDDQIKEAFAELHQIVVDISRVTWKTDQQIWPQRDLQRASRQPNDRMVKKAIVQDIIWHNLYYHIFLSPFRMMGDKGRELEIEWSESFPTESDTSDEKLVAPYTSVKAERWRYMTLKGCQESLSSKLSPTDPRGAVKLGFKNTLDETARLLKAELKLLLNLDQAQEALIDKLCGKSSVQWLDFAMHRCRIAMTLPGSKETRHLRTLSQKVEYFQTKPLTLTIMPELGRWGSVKGLELEVYSVIRGCAGDSLDIP